MGWYHGRILTCDETACGDEYVTNSTDLVEAIGKAEGDHWRHEKRGRSWVIYCPDHRGSLRAGA